MLDGMKMAEFCLKCWNELTEMSLTEKDVVISKDLWLCEGCGKIKNVIKYYNRTNFLIRLLRFIIRR